MEKLRLGILSTGGIAKMMAKTVNSNMNGMDNVELYAVASRDGAKAQAFAQEFAVANAYGSYEEMAKDPNVDLVYVASPHSHHFEHSMLFLQNGRPVLCEKAFTANAAQARQLISYAEQNRIFLTEAMWTRFQPLTKKIATMANDGTIGKPLMVQVNVGQYLTHVQRMWDPALAGGALLDLSVYSITLASVVLGPNVKSVTSDVVYYKTGVDAVNTIVLHYDDMQTAVLNNSFIAGMPQVWYVVGEEGMLEVTGIYNPQQVRVLDKKGNELAKHECPPQATGYEFEVAASFEALKNGQLECAEITHAETLRVMELMDSLRFSWGIKFPFEQP